MIKWWNAMTLIQVKIKLRIELCIENMYNSIFTLKNSALIRIEQYDKSQIDDHIFILK